MRTHSLHSSVYVLPGSHVIAFFAGVIMETVLRIKILKDNITQNDVYIKKLLKEICDCDADSQKLNELNIEVVRKFNQIKQDLLDLKMLIKTIEDSQLRYNLMSQMESIQNQCEINMVVVRKAIQSSQRTINNKNRSKLFEYSSQLRNRLDQSTSKAILGQEMLANQSSALTDNLYSVSRMLASEVEKSSRSLETLSTSSATVTETSEEFKTMSNYIANSKTLLSKYGRREMTDKILTILAFGFFFGCVIYVLVKRLYLR